MRHVITLLFMCLLSIPFLSVFGWLSLEKHKVRREVKHKIMEHVSNDELISFSFKLEDTTQLLRWEHSGEFEYQGEMYDVIRRAYHGDSITYFLWWDHEETKLNRKLTQLTMSLLNQSQSKEQSSQQLAYFLSHLFLNEPFAFEHAVFMEDHIHLFRYAMRQSSIYAKTPCPPPRDLHLYS